MGYGNTERIMRSYQLIWGFDHGAGHPPLFLCNAKILNYRKDKALHGVGSCSEWPKVADAVIKALFGVKNPALITVRATWVPSGLPLGSSWWTERRWW
jgi:hypothetical protein